MSILFHIRYGDDLFEIAVSGYRITRITRYFGGTGMRQEVDYNSLPEQLQTKIVDKIMEAWSDD